MRLLSRSHDGHYRLTEFYDDQSVPPYAILSHVWIKTAAAEPTFTDLRDGIGQEKPGYRKIEFCGDQAERDKLKYFWVDTCCINKENPSELSHAIQSMYRWYCRSTICYVYLYDVHGSAQTVMPRSWDSELYKSTWFTRGWTLQELLAPGLVKFFNQKGAVLGTKIELAEHISEITSVPMSALSGRAFSRFSREERFAWSKSRLTSRPEDRAYCLLGIFDVDMPIDYGEGFGTAIRRLEKVIERRDICIRDIRLSDPRDDKKRIEETKGGLLKDACRWGIESSEFRRWHASEESSILWVKGEPGKGKTMLLCGMIDELEKSIDTMPVLSYFFCQAADRRTANATAVLRGLIYMFVHQWPSLVWKLQARYDTAGETLFEDANACIALSDILRDMLEDPTLQGAYLVVDALDECLLDRQRLLDFISTASSTRRVKCIVSSRNSPDIEKAFKGAGKAVKLSLELNEASVSAAVATYIHYRVKELATLNDYDVAEQHAVQHNLESGAHGTFLWVALVCRELHSVEGWEAIQLSQGFPPGLEPFYRRMVDQLCHSRRSKLCKDVLAVASVARRPLSLEEMSVLTSGGPPDFSKPAAWVSIVEDCGSFLTIRDKVISFVHHSARDFLMDQACSDIHPRGVQYAHFDICTRSLALLAKTLRRDICGIKNPGISIDQVKTLHSPDSLAAVRYSCVHWIEHLIEAASTRGNSVIKDGGQLDRFLREHFLYWLEALSLSRSMSEAQVSMSRLDNFLRREVCNIFQYRQVKLTPTR